MDGLRNLCKFLIKNVEKLRFEPGTLTVIFHWFTAVIVFGFKLDRCLIVQRLVRSILVIESHVFHDRLFEFSFRTVHSSV